MNGNSFVVDSNIFIYLIDGDKLISSYLENKICYISFITEIELYSFQKLTDAEEITIQKLLSNCIVMDVNEQIKKIAISSRKNYDLKIPDAIICATSIYLDIPLLTSDTHFKKLKEINLVFYEKI